MIHSLQWWVHWCTKRPRHMHVHCVCMIACVPGCALYIISLIPRRPEIFLTARKMKRSGHLGTRLHYYDTLLQVGSIQCMLAYLKPRGRIILLYHTIMAASHAMQMWSQPRASSQLILLLYRPQSLPCLIYMCQGHNICIHQTIPVPITESHKILFWVEHPLHDK